MQSFSYENEFFCISMKSDFHNKNFVHCLAFIMRFTLRHVQVIHQNRTGALFDPS